MKKKNTTTRARIKNIFDNAKRIIKITTTILYFEYFILAVFTLEQ